MSGKWMCVLMLCVLCSATIVLCQEEEEGYDWHPDDHGFVEKIQAAFNASEVDPFEVLTEPGLQAYGVDFDCDVVSSHTAATSVHELTPADIKVVAAMGDSVTAGFGAKARNIFEALTEYRGVSWSIGGDEDLSTLVTIPNIIKKYNPNVKGFSIKTGKHTSSNSKFNVAVSGAIAKDMEGQARELVKRIRGDSSIDFENDWKLVTIWIGGNDLCAVCKGKDENTPENYVNYIETAINYLHSEMPRTFVNLVKILDVTEISKLAGFFDIICGLVHWFACDCASEDITKDMYYKYNQQLEDMVKNYQDDDGFALVLQPFMQGVTLPKNDPKSYFAPDCFHFSKKAHQIAATALWNNMIEPVGKKDENLDMEDENLKPNCPSSKYFFTRKNSLQYNEEFGFGIESNDPNANSDPSSSSDNILAILLGTGITLYIAAMVTLFTIIGVIWVRRRRGRGTYHVTADSEKILLVKK